MTGKRSIDTVFVILTPFHYKSFLSVNGDSMKQNNVLILFEKYIDHSNWNINPENLIAIPEVKFSVFELRKHFFETVSTYRRQIRFIRQFCKKELNNFNLDSSITINIGSDRDIFTQVFLNTLFKHNKEKKVKLIAYEEGIGFYDKKNFFEHIKTILYPILSPILFGEKLNFNKPLGTDRRIKEVYCRFPTLIKNNGFSHYKKLNVRENTIEGTYNKDSNKVLVFSFPSSTVDILEQDKIKWLSILYNKLNTNEFVIKLHPREENYNISLIDPNFNWIFLEGQYPIERLNYFEYKYIVNFNSSIIMDVLSSSYPPDKIITIGLYKKLSIASLYDQTTYLNIKDLADENTTGL